MVSMLLRRCVARLGVLLLISVTPAVAAPVASPDVAPGVPRPAGVPCVVDLFHNQKLMSVFFDGVVYAPPPGCPGPWAKVVLELTMTGARYSDSKVSRITLNLGGVTVFNGASQLTPHATTWRVERDLTDYAALLGRPNILTGDSTATSPYGDETSIIGSGRLLFYRPTAQIRAPRVPDVVYQVGGLAAGNTLESLPHNIERAYLDVVARADDLWFTCVPTASGTAFRSALFNPLGLGDGEGGIFPDLQGCSGGSFREVVVSIDGVPAGTAQVFPWLPSDLNGSFQDTVDTPAPTLQTFAFAPYRVDLTPFAGALNDPGPHTVVLADASGAHYFVDAQLLLYLDRGRAHVSGGVTLNTLTNGVAPRVTNTLSAYCETLNGKVVTRLQRHFEIRGFVNTSHGRVDSNVRQTEAFSDTQVFHVVGSYPVQKSYEQNVWLESTVDRRSRSTRGDSVLSDDHEHISYPLRVRYYGKGYVTGGDYVDLASANVTVHQRRIQDSGHYRPGLPYYISHVDDVFDGSRTRHSTGPDTNWQSAKKYTFIDNQHSCYESTLTTLDGALAASATGVSCPEGRNSVRWFAHPDGSPVWAGCTRSNAAAALERCERSAQQRGQTKKADASVGLS